jgi:hypothetical protein
MALAVGALFVAQRVLVPGGVGSAPEGVSLAWSLLLPEEARAAYDALDAAAAAQSNDASAGTATAGAATVTAANAVPDPDPELLLVAETSTDATLDGQMLSISGFMVPLDNDRRSTRQFLLVPYQGACIHTPAPPPNQVISVYSDKDARRFHNWQPVTITGRMSVASDSTALAEAGYVMALEHIEAFREDAAGEGFAIAEGAHDSPLL